MTQPESKRAVIALSHCAIRISEIGQLTVKTVLFPSGKIKDEIFLPASICKNLRPRTAWLSGKTKKIIQEWIDHRKSKKWGVMPNSFEFQQLNPNSKLIFSCRGYSYSIQDKKRIMKDGTIKIYKACDSLELVVRAIYKKCGLSSASSHSGRRSLVTNAALSGVDLEYLSMILGHRSIETTIIYVEISKTRLKEMYKLDWI
ncbi:Integrase family protein [Moritella viscosa]|uniref:Integrase family protein n=2 Tax=Moritella viscosa TaxID=80854 RepID=A0ABY1HJ55_9GAMM|nr:Integrase family protein [Moritella viscosa]